MEIDLCTNKLHDEILDIMDVIKDLCDRNDIRYFITGGTLLGAIRHGGFIPWDDDFDIVMPRKDFNKFLSIAKTNLPTEYGLKWFSTDEHYYLLYAKVEKKGTLFGEELLNGKMNNSGIFVDVFPIDDSNGYSLIVALRKKVLSRIQAIMYKKRNGPAMTGVKKIVASLFTEMQLYRIAHLIMTIGNDENKQYYSNYGSHYDIKRKVERKNYYGVGKLIKFEDRFYNAPEKYDELLKQTFGNKYLEIPPIEKRVSHFPLKVIFSDGTVYEHTNSSN